MTLQQICIKLETEHAAALLKHGKWKGTLDIDQKAAIKDEFREWLDAYYRIDIHGEHGEIEELIDLMNVAARRIMFLTGEDQ